MVNKASNNPEVFFSFLNKVITFKNSGLMPHSFIFSIIITPTLQEKVVRKIEVTKVFISIFSEEIIRGLILNLMIFIVGLGLYIVVFLFDFITGMRASRREHLISAGTTKGYVQSDKLWSSIWKLFAVIVITTILTAVNSMLVLIDQNTLHQGGMLITLFFFIMVTSFDVHSIGENQERRFGKKPKIYVFLDNFFEKMGDLVMLRIKKFFGMDGTEDMKEEESEDNIN